MQSERQPRGFFVTGLASEYNKKKIPYISKILCGLSQGIFI